MLETINPLADRWLFWMSHITVQATVIAAAILIVVRGAKRIPANVRYVMLLLALAKFVVPPFLPAPTGIFSFVVLTSDTGAVQAPFKLVPPKNDRLIVSQTDQFTGSGQPLSPAENVKPAEVIPPRLQGSLPKESQSRPADVATSHSVVLPGPEPTWRSWLLVFWIIGVLVVLLRMLNGAWRLNGIVKRSRPASGDSEHTFVTLAKSMSVRRPRLLLSQDPVTPMACGLICSTVVVPESMIVQFSQEEQRAIFAHELAHHRRCDPLFLWMQGVIFAIWWFHPLVWLLNRTLLRERERCCDDLVVLESITTRKTYAAALVRAVEWCSVRTRALGYVAPQMHPLQDRITSLIDTKVERSAKLSRWNWVVMMILGLVVLPGFCMHASEIVANQARVVQDTNEDVELPATSTLCDLGGQVLNDQGQPVQATVWLRMNSAEGTEFESTTTDATGRYRFPRAKPGFVTVSVLADGYSHGGALFTLQKGRIERNLNLLVTESNTLSLKIRDGDGVPVVGAKLFNIEWKTPERGTYGLYEPLLTQQNIVLPMSNADGVLTFPGVPDDAECEVLIHHPDHVRKSVANVRAGVLSVITLERGIPIVVRAVNADSLEPVVDATVNIFGRPEGIRCNGVPVGGDGTYRTRFPVSPEQVSISVQHPRLAARKRVLLKNGTGAGGFEFRLYRTGTVRGRIVNESTNEPCGGVSISLAKDRQQVARQESAEDGTFEISCPAGTYQASATGNGFVVGDNTRRTKKRVTVKPNVVVELGDINARLLPKIRGIVLLPNGEPAASTVVVCNEAIPTSRRTDVDGRFEFQVRRLWHTVVTASRLTESLGASLAIDSKDIVEGKQFQLQLQPESELQGSVVNADGTPTRNVEVSLGTMANFGEPGSTSRMWSTLSTLTVANGCYRFPGISRGDLRYQATVGSSVRYCSPDSKHVRPQEAVVHLDSIHLPAKNSVVSDSRRLIEPPPLTCREWINSPGLKLESLRGKVVLLNFCAAWSDRSIQQFPSLQEVHELYGHKGLVVVRVYHSSASLDEIGVFAKRKGLTYPIGLDVPSGDTCNSYNVNFFPTTRLIGRDGKISMHRLGGTKLLTAVRRAVLAVE